MPADLVRRINLDLLYPPLLSKYLALLARCRDRGADYFAISGYRSPDEQTALYLQGRTLPGPVVTNARAYRSLHNYGLAVDSCRDADATREGLQPSWQHADYLVLREEGAKDGLTPLSFEDPHVQLDIAAKGVTVEMLERVWRRTHRETDALKAVWRYLDERGPW